MKYNFSNYSIVIAHIKEFLHDFNLPMVDVWRDDMTPHSGKFYIKDKNLIQECIIDEFGNVKWKTHSYYTWNSKIINLTKNLIINSSEYDNYTHEYLGNYLRLLRDLKNINLMGMYNCFNGDRPSLIEHTVKINYDSINREIPSFLCTDGKYYTKLEMKESSKQKIPVEKVLYIYEDKNGNLIKSETIIEPDPDGFPRLKEIEKNWIPFTNSDGSVITTSKTFNISNEFVIDTTDDNYNYFIVPIKFDQVYTVAIDSDVDYELCCIIYSNRLISDSDDENFKWNIQDKLIKDSYQRINGSKYRKPFIIDTHKINGKFDNVDEYWFKENDLKLLLKLPSRINSSITVLEGNWLESSNIVDNTLVTEYIYNENDDIFPNVYFGRNSLLMYDNSVSYPFSDRLIEYLLDNCITSNDQIENNVERIQNKVYPEKIEGYYDIWDDKLRNNIHKETINYDLTRGLSMKYGNIIIKKTPAIDSEGNIDGVNSEGVWEIPKRFIDYYDDITCYVDKDIETMSNFIGWSIITLVDGKDKTDTGSSGTKWIVVKNNRVLDRVKVPERVDTYGHKYNFIGYFDLDGKMYYDSDGDSMSKWDKNNRNDRLYAKWGD